MLNQAYWESLDASWIYLTFPWLILVLFSLLEKVAKESCVIVVAQR